MIPGDAPEEVEGWRSLPEGASEHTDPTWADPRVIDALPAILRRERVEVAYETPPAYPFQALMDQVQAHVNENGGDYLIVEGQLNYKPCGHALKAAVAVPATSDEEQFNGWRDSAFLDLLERPCPECARLEALRDGVQ